MRLTRTVWLAGLALAGLVCLARGQEVRRAPNMGFMGMRGKKSPLFSEDEAALEEYKRAPVMGFQGMRGKKAPSMGFIGMRGKKEDMSDLWDEDKRAPSANAFFGMRGKKAPSANAFFGMRGKKAPTSLGFYGTRGKKGPSGFIGMRGKKDDFEDIDSLLEYLRASDPRIAGGEEDFMDSRAKRFAPEENFQDTLSEQEFL